MMLELILVHGEKKQNDKLTLLFVVPLDIQSSANDVNIDVAPLKNPLNLPSRYLLLLLLLFSVKTVKNKPNKINK